MMNLSWKEIMESEDFCFMSYETGEVFDNLEQAIADGADFGVYQWSASFGWVLIDEVVW